MVGLRPQHAGAHSVEGAHSHVVRHGANEAAQPFLHLPGRLVGEGDRHDAVGVDAILLNDMRNAMGDDARLAAAGARQDKQRPAGVGHRAALLRVQGCKNVHE